MIDRGALVVARIEGETYRGVHRLALDAQPFTGKRGRELGQRYRDAIVAGDGVIEDLDEAIALCEAATKIGVEKLEVLVFEVPQEPAPRAGSLPIAAPQPAEGLVLLGWDAIEMLEPFWSPVAAGKCEAARNEHGLMPDRAAADAFVSGWNRAHADEDPVVAVRVWVLS